jgi:hypothetical protein
MLLLFFSLSLCSGLAAAAVAGIESQLDKEMSESEKPESSVLVVLLPRDGSAFQRFLIAS